jgi:beta-phosphoglucomutase-like phosphatase (HAD superfamily)
MEGQIGVIFDMDGVIVNTNPYHKKAWLSFCEHYGVVLSDLELKTEVFGRINENALKYILLYRVRGFDIRRHRSRQRGNENGGINHHSSQGRVAEDQYVDQ